MCCVNFMHIENVILELLHTFYFWNICDMSDPKSAICIRRKNLKITIWKFQLRHSRSR